jgi:endo-1,4-beta-D-glucanase Y
MKPLKKQLLLLTLVFVFSMPGCSQEIKTAGFPSIDSVPPQIPFPTRMTYGKDVLHPNHLTKDEQDDLVREAYRQWKKKYLVMVSGKNSSETQYRITAGSMKRSKSFSEGLGYGMMFAVFMAGFDQEAQPIFDGLLRFVNNNPSSINKKLMAYQVPVPRSQRDSAFDGDADIAFALLLADKQWGSSGPVNYRKEAIIRINALFDTVVGKESFLPMLGDWVEPDGHQYNQYSVRSSDILPSHFKLFASVTSNPKWLLVDERCHAVIDAIQKQFSPISGLVPDFIIGTSDTVPTFKPAPPNYLESKYDGQYFYNAARVPWRLGADALLFADRSSQIQVRRIADWVVNAEGTDPSKIGPGYYLNGRRLSNSTYLSKAFIGPFGVAAMNIKNSQTFVNQVFDICSGVQQDYYEDSIGLFCLLLMTGNYWLPQ